MRLDPAQPDHRLEASLQVGASATEIRKSALPRTEWPSELQQRDIDVKIIEAQIQKCGKPPTRTEALPEYCKQLLKKFIKLQKILEKIVGSAEYKQTETPELSKKREASTTSYNEVPWWVQWVRCSTRKPNSP